jgi:hypothetical protein
MDPRSHIKQFVVADMQVELRTMAPRPKRPFVPGLHALANVGAHRVVIFEMRGSNGAQWWLAAIQVDGVDLSVTTSDCPSSSNLAEQAHVMSSRLQAFASELTP